jgi:polysaccharide export outer membrane protein
VTAMMTGLWMRIGSLIDRTSRRNLRVGIVALVGVVFMTVGCGEKIPSARWMLNGFFDPTQVGQFEAQKRNEIRSALSILEEPAGIQNTEEPQPEDLEANYADQRLAPGDVVNVSVFELVNPGENTFQQIRVSPSGFETIPVVGRVRVAGLTTRELELELKQRLRDAQILDDAEVQVSLVETRQNQFSVIGTVSRPGTYALPTPEYRLLNALAEAGGISPLLENVYLFRRWGVPEGAGTIPTSDGAGVDAMVNVALRMSDVSTTSSSSAPSTSRAIASTSRADDAPSSTKPTAAVSPVDELKILEGGTTESAPSVAPRWDAEKGEWLLEPVAPTTRTTTPGGLARMARPTSEGAEPEKSPWDVGMELSSSTRIIEIPVRELLQGDPRYNVVVRPFDLINVPPGNIGEFFLMGNVARPGAYDLSGRRLTVKEAIASGGGFGPLAWPSRADLIRRIGRDEEQMIQLDLDAIFAGTAPDFYLKPNDVVNVGTNAAAPFLAVLRNAFRFSYGFGFVYDRNFADSDTFQAREQVKQRRFQESQARGLPGN